VLLWRGAVNGTIAVTKEQRAAVLGRGPLDPWIHYLDACRTIIPCYRVRHRHRQYSGGGQADKVDKANDLLVARRQKNQGMHGSEETSVGLIRLRTLRLNEDWDHY
jgi:hypothetical protein